MTTKNDMIAIQESSDLYIQQLENEIKELKAMPLWHAWHGGECPIPEGKWCVVWRWDTCINVSKNPKEFDWKENLGCFHIMKYAIIEPPVGVGDE